MPTWDYDANQYSKEDFTLIPEGEYRVKIAEANNKQSSTMKDMIVLKLSVEGFSSHVFYNLVLDPEKPQMVNQNIGRILDSFRLPDPGKGELPYWTWQGAYGAARIKHGEYKGNRKAEIGSFLTQEKQAELRMRPIKQQSHFESLPSLEPEIMSLSDPEGDADIPF